MVTRIGRDAFGDIALSTWDAAGVDAAAVERAADDATGAAYIFVDAATGDNAIIVAPGAAGGIDAAFVEARADRIGGAAVFVTQLEQPMGAAMRALEIASDGGAVTVLNPAPADTLPAGMLALCDYLTPNETEAAALAGAPVADLDGARRAGDALLAAGVRRAVILTLGPRGALYHSADRSELVPAFDAGPVAETTGAGDAFNGGFAAALAEGRDPLDAVRLRLRHGRAERHPPRRRRLDAPPRRDRRAAGRRLSRPTPQGAIRAPDPIRGPDPQAHEAEDTDPGPRPARPVRSPKGKGWRRRRDSNPRYLAVYSLSRGAPSTTRPRLRRRV